MRIDVSKFGKILISRPQGREAFLAARAYVLPRKEKRIIELDFGGVTVLTPSWADEFIRGLKSEVGENNVKVLQGGNASVHLSLKTISGQPEV